jgi:hypothetical protein
MGKHNPHFVVGIAGRSGSGKTTVARLLREHFVVPRRGAACEVRKFAGPLKEMLRIVGVEKGDEPGETPHEAFRDAAQAIGQWFRSNVDRDFWVDLQRHALAGLSAPTVVVFDDVRYANEVEMCDLVVGLTTARDAGLSAEQMLHASERVEELEVDYTVENNTPADPAAIADAVYGEVTKRWRQE